VAESFHAAHDKRPDSARNSWRATLKSRIVVAAVGLFLWSTAIEARLIYLQVYRHADLIGRAERQQLRTIASSGKRGEIPTGEGMCSPIALTRIRFTRCRPKSREAISEITRYKIQNTK